MRRGVMPIRRWWVLLLVGNTSERGFECVHMQHGHGIRKRHRTRPGVFYLAFCSRVGFFYLEYIRNIYTLRHYEPLVSAPVPKAGAVGPKTSNAALQVFATGSTVKS